MTTVIHKINSNQESNALPNRNSSDLYNYTTNTGDNLKRINNFLNYTTEEPIRNRASHFTSQHLLRFDSLPSHSSNIASKYLLSYNRGAPSNIYNYENSYRPKLSEKFLNEYNHDKDDASYSSDLRSSDENDDQNVNENDQYDEEFKSVLKRITIKNGKILMKKSDSSSSTNDVMHIESRSNVNKANQEDISNDNNLNPTSITVTTLKYLFKLLKFYKLEHYMSDLIENGYHTPISLHKLKQNELDMFNVSPYDKKKFLKLQLFIKQLMVTINKSKRNGHSRNSHSGRSTNRSTSSASLNGHKMSEEEKRFLESSDFKNFNSKLSTMQSQPSNVEPSITKTKSWNDYNFIKDVNNNNNDVKNSIGVDLDDVDDDDPSSYVSYKPKSLSASNLPNEIGSSELLEENKIKEKIEPTALVSRTNISQKEPSWSVPKNTDNTTATTVSFDPNRNKSSSKRIVPNNLPKSIPNNSTTFSRKESSTQSRAKSSEPTLHSTTRQRALNLNAPITSKSSTENKSSVCHPTLTKVGKNSNSNFFGPKLPLKNNTDDNNNNNNFEQKEANNVKIIETQTYNYGVPQKQQIHLNTQSHKRPNYGSSNSSRKTKSNSYKDNHNHTNRNKVTADIFVYARKRPLLESESHFNDAIVIENGFEETKNICVNEMKSLVDGTPLLRKNEFEFDRTFDSSNSNEDIFKTSIMPFVDVPIENRIDFTCICFGQTGSGKTHTLFGNKLQDGICVLTAQVLFKNTDKIFCGFYEIYNGQLYDLLNLNNRLVLREDSNGQVNVVGLVEVEVKNLNELKNTIDVAQNNRHIGSTSFNRASSRSHAIIQFKIQNVPLKSNQTGQQIIVKNNQSEGVKSKVNSGLNSGTNNKAIITHRVLFIDLAGSERGIDAQNNLNDNRKEGAEINQSLLALKECIRCIDQYCVHAPFRQSKLTRVLRDCFIGFGRTILIATVSPTEDCVSCSLNTLQYANRVRQMTIRNRKPNEKVLRKTTSSANVLYASQKIIKSAPLQSQQQLQPPKNKNVEENISKLVISQSAPINSSNQTNKNPTKSTQPTSKDSKPIINSNASHSKAKTSQLFSINTANTNPSQNILPPKPTLKYQQISVTNSQNPSLFHPSKINMSSTPIKTLINGEKDSTYGEEMIFENDTPIKGHKFKYIASNGSKAIAHLAEKYFNKVEEKPKSLSNTNQVIYNRNKSREQQTYKSNQAEANELNDRIYYREIPKIKDDILNRYAEIKYDKYSNFDEKINMRHNPELDRDDFFDIKNKNRFTSDLVYSKKIATKDFYTEMPTSSYLQKSSQITKPYSPLNNLFQHSLTSTLAPRNTTAIPSQLSKLTNELDRINDRQIYRSPNLANANNRNSTTKLTNNFAQRYKSIYSTDSPSRSPIQQDGFQSRLNVDAANNQKLAKNNYVNHLNQNGDETNANTNNINNNVSVMEENLIQLRKKQKELLEFKKATNLYMANNSGNDTNDQIDDDCLNDDNVNSDPEVEKLIENSNLLLNQLQNDTNVSIDVIKNDANSQRQIRNYIQLLENKLSKLRAEQTLVSDENSKNHILKAKSFRERSVSSDSCDSLKEIENRHNETNRMYSKVIFNEFMQRKNKLEKDQQNYYETNKNPVLFGDDYDKQFIEMQMQLQEPASNNKSPNSLANINNNRQLEQLSGDENNQDNDSFKKSLHKGNMSEVFFSKIDKRGKDLSDSAKKLDFSSLNEPLICEFSPITQIKNDEIENNQEKNFRENKANFEENRDSTDKTNYQLTPRSQFNKHQLVNPIPIRLSSSSSFDSSNQPISLLKASNTNGFNKNDEHSSSYENQNSSRSLVSSNEGSNVNLKNSNSKIWKPAVNNHSDNKHTWSNVLKENDAISSSQNENDHLLTLKANVESTHPNTPDGSNENKSLNKLVVAHEHQLSDLTETCKMEMNLLSCLKDSQMGIDDYLNKMEEMLSKKAHSIRDLQDQISQLKTLKSSNGNTVNLSAHENY